MAFKLKDSFYKNIIQVVFVIDVCALTRICKEVIRTFLRRHVGWLHVLQDGCVEFGDGFVACEVSRRSFTTSEYERSNLQDQYCLFRSKAARCAG